MTTLTQYKYGNNDADARPVIAETMVGESELLKVLDFDELADNNVSRQKMFYESDVQEHEVGGTWTIVNPTWEYRDAPLCVIGDNVTVDDFGALAFGTSQAAVMAQAMAEKARGMSRKFDRLSIYAKTTANGDLSGSAMVGLLTHIMRVESSATVDCDGWLYTGSDSAAHNKQVLMAASGASAALVLAMVATLRDAVRPRATHFIMSRLMRRKIEALAQASGQNLKIGDEKLGRRAMSWDDVQIVVNDQIKDNMPDSSTLVTSPASYNYDTGTGDISPVFAINISKMGFCGVNGRGMIQIENLAGGGPLENLDARGKRIKAYLGTALRNHKAAAVLLNANYAG